MAGVIFPDIGRTLGPLIQMDRQREQSDREFSQRSQDRADNLAFRKEESQQRNADRDETRAMRIQTQLASMDEKKRAMVQGFATFRAHAGGAILGMSPEQQPQAYAMFREEAKARGYDLSLFPEQWSPATAARLKFDVEQSIPWAEKAVPFQPGGGAPAPSSAPATVAPDATKAGGQISSRLTGTHGFSPVAAAGVTGGLYQESGFDPGYGFTRPGGDNGTAHGVAQWRLDRADGLKKFAIAQGKPPTDLDTQVDYLVSEMKSGDMGAQRAYAMLQQAKTPEEATTAMMHFFRPAGYTPNNPQGGHGYQQRVQYAQRFANPADVGAVPGNPAPMPDVTAQQAGALPGNPAQMPGGFPMPPGVEQGGGEGRNDVRVPSPAAPGQGQMLPTTDGGTVPSSDLLTQIQLPPGARFVTRGGKISKNGDAYEIMYSNGTRGEVRAPPKKGEAGPFGGTGMDQQAHRIVLEGMQAGRTNTPEYAAAHAHISAERILQDPTTGGITRIKPNVGWAAPPTYGNNQVPQPAELPASGSKTVTVEPGKGKALDNSARDDLTKASGGVLELTELVKSLKPEYGGYVLSAVGDVVNFVKQRRPEMLGGGDSTGQAQWWQRYAQFANLERNKLFGSALTPGETASFNKAMVDPGMRPDQIKENLARQQEIASKALSRIANSMKAGGYNQEAIEAATGIRMGDMPDPIGTVPQAKPAPKGADREKLLFDARKAIDQGAPRDAVIKRLRENGVEDEP